ncbi:MAG: hypothetical protein GY774_35005 [Planctomycetes bacterium]|nr:hypothetical protein [Planctomycetota bacterium]
MDKQNQNAQVNALAGKGADSANANRPDLRDYRLIINMAGEHFDGELNLETLFLTNGKFAYPLEIISVRGMVTDDKTDTNIGTYQIECQFDDDLDEVEEGYLSTPGINVDADLGALLADSAFKGQINLASGTDPKASDINIGRIRSMSLINIHDETFHIPVTYSTAW